MDKRQEHLETLTEIRSLMEQSARFISLSGLSGVAAGIFALIGATFVYIYTGLTPFDGTRYYYIEAVGVEKWGMNYITFFLLDAVLVLIFALASGFFFTNRNASRKGQKIWDKLTWRLLYNLAIPLAAGGIFSLGLMYHGAFGLVAPTTLIFYGLALVNASKFTLRDLHYLGLCEVALGLISLFFIGYGLEFWAIGFGFLHIFYGVVMYYKYER